MIRSQSISNFGETKKKTGFFTALRTRKSSKDLNGVLAQRPLSQSTLVMNLNVASGATASKRHSVLLLSTDDKENIPQTSLRKHSSASNLQDPRRNSVFMRKPQNSTREKTIAIAPSPASEIASVNSTYLERPSPFSPLGTVAADPYDPVDPAPIDLQDFDKGYIYNDEPSSPSKLRRTTNLNNIHDFVKTMDDSLLPLCNRASLEFEAKEIDVLQKRLAQAEALELKLVENVMFLSCFSAVSENDNQQILLWDNDDDLLDALKNDTYSDDEDMALLA